MASGLEFQIKKVEGLHYLWNENKGADQLHCYHMADLCFVSAYVKSRFSHDMAKMVRQLQGRRDQNQSKLLVQCQNRTKGDGVIDLLLKSFI